MIMIRRPIFAVSTAFLLMGGSTLSLNAADQSESIKKELTLSAAAVEKQLESVPRNSRKVFTALEGVTGEQRYIVRFKDESLAAHMGNLKRGKKLAKRKKGEKLNVKSRESQDYVRYLKGQQSDICLLYTSDAADD